MSKILKNDSTVIASNVCNIQSTTHVLVTISHATFSQTTHVLKPQSIVQHSVNNTYKKVTISKPNVIVSILIPFSGNKDTISQTSFQPCGPTEAEDLPPYRVLGGHIRHFPPHGINHTNIYILYIYIHTIKFVITVPADAQHPWLNLIITVPADALVSLT